jgi:imidazoleglycerol phosphate synthase glutamine amidotransferase subunit HisH
VDYGAGNIVSIRNMQKKAGFDAEYEKDVSTIEKAEK